MLKLISIISISLLFTAWLDPFRDEVTKGNSQYQNKNFDKARDHYNSAEEYAPGEESKKKLYLNRGNAEYMKGNYQKAIDNYNRSLQSGDSDVQKKSFFNMGNTYMKMKKDKEAVESFINALKIDPTYEKAKRNIEYLLSKKQKQQDKKDKNSDNKSKDKDEKQQKSQDKKDGGDDRKDKKNSKSQENKNIDGEKMNREQVKNLLESMKKKPVRRQKGKTGERRYLEKYW